jgi:annexin A7/11
LLDGVMTIGKKEFITVEIMLISIFFSFIVECVQDKVLFFAHRLHKAMEGAGTNDTSLIRIIISRSEIDLGNIKKSYEKVFNKTLYSAVKVSFEFFVLIVACADILFLFRQSETSGDYKRALLALIGDA